MKKPAILLAVVCLVAACADTTPEPTAYVELIGALKRSYQANVFIISGLLQNTGTTRARLVHVTISIAGFGGDTCWNFSDSPDIDAGSYSDFTVAFLDTTKKYQANWQTVSLSHIIAWED